MGIPGQQEESFPIVFRFVPQSKEARTQQSLQIPLRLDLIYHGMDEIVLQSHLFLSISPTRQYYCIFIGTLGNGSKMATARSVSTAVQNSLGVLCGGPIGTDSILRSSYLGSLLSTRDLFDRSGQILAHRTLFWNGYQYGALGALSNECPIDSYRIAVAACWTQ